MRMSPEIGALAAALAKAQGTFEAPKKSHKATVNSAKGSYTYNYSTLDELIAATRPALIANELATVQNVLSLDSGTVGVATTLIHSSGQWIEFDAVALPSGATPQTVGAATTYARRYSLGAALNVAAEDDDDAQSVKPLTSAEMNAAVKAGYEKAPKGYGDWLLDMEAVVAEGTEKLQAAWKASKVEFRTHLTAQAPKQWEAMKAAAAKVTVAA